MTRRALIAAGLAAAAAGAVLAGGAAVGHPGAPGERYVSVEWTRAVASSSRSRTVEVTYRYRGYACQYRFHRAAARETERTVTIKVLAHRRELREGEACTAVLGGGTAKVRLDEPVGERRLRHAPVSDPRR